MDYQTETILGIIKLAIWFGIFFGALPFLVFPRPRGETAARTLMVNFVLITFLAIFVGHVLVLLHIYDFFSLAAIFALLFIVLAFRRAHKSPLQGVSAVSRKLTLVLFEIGEQRISIRDVVKRWLLNAKGRIVSGFPKGSELIWWGGLLWVLVVSGYLRLEQAIGNAAPGPREAYLHLAWVKDWGLNHIYPDGISPQGMHALVSALGQSSFVAEEILVRTWGGLSSVLLVGIICVITYELTNNRGAALISAAIYGIFAFDGFIPGNASSQITLTSLNTSLVALLPTFFFLVTYLTHREQRYLILYSVGLATSFCIDPLAGTIALITMIPAMICGFIVGSFTSLRCFPQVFIASAAAALVGNLFLLIGLASDKPVYNGYVDFYRQFIESPFINGDIAASSSGGLPVVLVVSAIALFVLIFSQRFARSEEDRVNAVFWGFLALVLAILYLPAAYNIPELFDPYFIEVILGPVLCIIFGLLYGRIGALIAFLLQKGSRFWGSITRTRYAEEGIRSAHLGIAIVILGLMTIQTSEFVVESPQRREHDVFAEKVVEIKRSNMSYTWTIVSSTEELPQVMGEGFFMKSSEFVDKYSPEGYRSHPGFPELAVPTPEVFIFLEKQIFIGHNSRREIEQRIADQGQLIDWIKRFELTHENLRVFYEDDKVKIFNIYRTPEEEEVFEQWWKTEAAKKQNITGGMK